MTRYLLDTNIISNVVKPRPSPPLLSWMAERSDSELFIASFTVAELRRGVLSKPAGRKRLELERWFDGPHGPQGLFADRILPFDTAAALVWGRLMAEGTAAGRPRSALDMIFAAVAEANDCLLVSDNARHFAGIPVFNPLRPA